jgi:hypothetical protein
VTRAERAEIVRLYKSGIASLAVAERMKLSKSCVLGILRAEGVVMRPQGTRSASVSLASWTGEDSWVSRFVGEIRRARAEGRLGERFRAADVRRACPGWASRTYSVFLPKHRERNPGGNTAYSGRTATGATACSTDDS